MKTAKEFMERLQNDEAFANQVSEGINGKKAAGAKDYTEALLPVAAELGYEITVEQVEAMMAKQSEAISEEELGKAAGGTSCTLLASLLAVCTGASAGAITYSVVDQAMSDETC